MKKYRYLIIDDDSIDLFTTNYHLKQYPFFEHCASFSSAKDGLNYINAQDNKIDVLFLDIDMDEITGLELLKLIENKIQCVVFITSHAEFAIEGFDLNAFDYIVKPLVKERFDRCVKRLQDYFEIKFKAELFELSFNKDTIMVKAGYNYVKIQPYEILYLEALKDYTKIVLISNKTVTIHGNLGSILNNEQFSTLTRVHRSFAIQKCYIQTIKQREIVLENNINIPFGQTYRKALLNILT